MFCAVCGARKCYFLIIIFATGALYECKNRIIFYEFLPIILIYLLFFCFYTGVFLKRYSYIFLIIFFKFLFYLFFII